MSNELRCRVCGCTEMNACSGGCGWAPNRGDLCTVCAEAVEALVQWAEDCRRASYSALLREAKDPWFAKDQVRVIAPVDPYVVACPTCLAGPGRKCRGAAGKAHTLRLRAATLGLSGGLSGAATAPLNRRADGR